MFFNLLLWVGWQLSPAWSHNSYNSNCDPVSRQQRYKRECVIVNYIILLFYNQVNRHAFTECKSVNFCHTDTTSYFSHLDKLISVFFLHKSICNLCSNRDWAVSLLLCLFQLCTCVYLMCITQLLHWVTAELWQSQCGWGNKPDLFTICLQGVTRRFVERMHVPSWWRRTLSWQSALSKLCLGSCMRCTAHRLAPLSDTSALEPSSGSSTLLMQSCWRMCWGTMLCPGNSARAVGYF